MNKVSNFLTTQTLFPGQRLCYVSGTQCLVAIPWSGGSAEAHLHHSLFARSCSPSSKGGEPWKEDQSQTGYSQDHAIAPSLLWMSRVRKHLEVTPALLPGRVASPQAPEAKVMPWAAHCRMQELCLHGALTDHMNSHDACAAARSHVVCSHYTWAQNIQTHCHTVPFEGD